MNMASIGSLLLWFCLAAHFFVLSPHQNSFHDVNFVKMLIGLPRDPGFIVNTVYFSVFSIIGLYNLYFQSLLIPAGRSGNKVPAWPFVAASYLLGVLALLPYFALWRRDVNKKAPPLPEELGT